MGRPAIKPSVAKLRGNPGHRPPRTPPATKAKAPLRPPNFSARASREWTWLVAQLRSMGLLAQCDRAVMVAYCSAAAEFWEADAQVQQDGMTFRTEKGYVGQHPAVSIRCKARKDSMRFAAEMGLTPSARTKIEVDRGKAGDKLDEFLA